VPLIKSNREFFAYQITGAMYMLQRSLGEFPYKTNGKIAPEFNEDAIIEAIRSLDCLPTGGGIVADQTGLGKTIQTLLFIALFTKYWQGNWFDGKRAHRPVEVVVPSQVVTQWADEIEQHWSKDLNLVVAYGTHKTMGATKKILRNSHMKNLPRLKGMPRALRYIFDDNDERASKTVILTSLETHTQRTVKTERHNKGELRSYDPPKFDKDGKELFTREVTTLASRVENFCSMVIVDEGHRLRNPRTKSFFSVAAMDAPFYWLLTATPMINSPHVGHPFSKPV
jgi:SNF2 family DNA or RNA helicase